MCSLYDPRDLWHSTTTVTTPQVAWFCPQKALLLEEKQEMYGQLLPLNSMPRSCFPVHLNAFSSLFTQAEVKNYGRDL